MNNRIQQLKSFYITGGEHRLKRQASDVVRTVYRERLEVLAGKSDAAKAAGLLELMLEAERPVVYPFDRIPIMRTVSAIPLEIFDSSLAGRRKHESGMLTNISVDYSRLLYRGFDAVLAEIEERINEPHCNEQGREYLGHMKDSLTAVKKFAGKYRMEAIRVGNSEVAEVLSRVPAAAPQSLYEAFVMFRLIHFTMWISGAYHNTVGRFDRLMNRYYTADIASGRLNRESALELIEEFFISFNKDSDLYTGVQQGDNGQSLVLGGLDECGNDTFGELSELCLKASCELSVIDPKINLRVSGKTPLSVYALGTELTKKGLGFPQYTNDDVVIKALKDWGYEKADAYNYSIAACWEIIIPGEGMEIPNIGALSFASAVEKAVREKLTVCDSYEKLFDEVKNDINAQLDRLCGESDGIYIIPSPFLSLMCAGCIEKARDITEGGKYNNYGIHGAGLSSAVDALAAVKKFVYDTKEISRAELLRCLAADYEGCDALYHKLRFDAPKMGNDDDYADGIACALLDCFSKSLKGRKNDRGGIFRAGTGSAMYYLWFSRELPATPDGRKYGEGLPANYSPGLFTRCRGPLSIIKSFTKPDLSECANGGPLTLELHNTVFRNDEGMSKVALLVKTFIDRGGHQLQLNSVNRDTLKDAQKHPENYRNLIVRVWGWSGYFVELDKEYQDHIIARCEY